MFRASSTRRVGSLLALCGCAALLALGQASPAAAQAWPSKTTIRIINVYPAGGPADGILRPLMNKLSERLGQAIIVDNRAGAGGVIGTTAAARSAPDGYTLLFAHVGPMAISPPLNTAVRYDPIKDFAPITQVSSTPIVLVARPGLGVNSLAELVAQAKANPGKISYASYGVGSTPHLAGEMLQSMAGIKLLHVPYKGAAPVLSDMLAGLVDISFTGTSSAAPQIAAGKLKGLGVTTTTRSALLPDMPAIAETYPGFEVNSWYGVVAPAGTPPEIVRRLHQEITALLKTPEFVQLLHAGGNAVAGTTPEQFAAKIKEETTRWARVVKEAEIPSQ